MIITDFSFYMALMWSSLFITLIYFLRKKLVSISFISVSGLLLIYLLCIVRMVLPFEIPYAVIIVQRSFYNQLTQVMEQEVGSGVFQYRISSILIVIWLVVAIVLFIYFAYAYNLCMLVMKLNGYEKAMDERFPAIMGQINSGRKRDKRIEILVGDTIKTPRSMGIFKRYILLPKKEYSNEQAFCILLHEYTHLRNGDQIVKLLINIMQCIFWWNPFVYLLRRDLEQILEIKCDLAIIKHLDSGKKADYLDTIISAIKESGCHFSNSSINIKERFRIVSKYKNIKDRRTKKNLLYVVAMVMLCLSYSFVIQSEFDAPIKDIEVKNGDYELNMSESYISTDDGNYWLVVPGQKKVVIDAPTAIKMGKEGFTIKEEEKDG